MRSSHWMAWIALAGCGGSGDDDAQAGKGGDSASQAGTTAGKSGRGSSDDEAGAGKSGRAGNAGTGRDAGGGGDQLQIPRIYPLVRAGTPAGLIANDAFREEGDPSAEIFDNDAGMTAAEDGNSLAHIVQQRIYTPGPTELLRLVSNLDARTANLDTDPSKHACLRATPVTHTWTFPGGHNFQMQLQCLDEWPGGWLAFGFAPAEPSGEDAGVDATSGDDFYMVQGQDGGMGGAYRIRGGSGDVEAWITVADSRAPNNSQVLMHLLVDPANATTELAFGGSGVGFCSAHLKTGANYVFVSGKTNTPPPPGAPNGHYCGSERSGCFSSTELGVDLGADANGCTPINASSFAIHTPLDSSSDPEGNVTPATIYQFFNNTKPTDLAEF